jgi:hypothetical protein
VIGDRRLVGQSAVSTGPYTFSGITDQRDRDVAQVCTSNSTFGRQLDSLTKSFRPFELPTNHQSLRPFPGCDIVPFDMHDLDEIVEGIPRKETGTKW